MTEASRKPVPLHPSVAKTLAAWSEETPNPADDDFVSPSLRWHGKKQLTPDMVEEGDSARARKGRHYGEGRRLAQLPSFARDQPSCCWADLKTAQELLRHANSRIHT